MEIKKILIKGLFGHLDYLIPLNENVTFVHGKNGCGKTTILKLLSFLFDMNYNEIYKIQFHSLKIIYDQKKDIEITKKLDKSMKCKIEDNIRVFDVDCLNYLWSEGYLTPTHFINTQRLINKDDDFSRKREKDSIMESSKKFAQILSTYTESYSKESQRIDGSFVNRLLSLNYQEKDFNLEQEYEKIQNRLTRLMQAGIIANIEEEKLNKFENLDDTKKEVLRMYLEDYNKKLDIYEDILKKIETFQTILSKKFSGKSISIEHDGIFFVDHFLHKKMEEILENQDETLFKRIFEYVNSEKQKEVADFLEKEFRKYKAIGKPKIFPLSKSYAAKLASCELSLLSSGEQHQIVLFFELLFGCKNNSLIMIDEPEISLHVDWQRQFFDDIANVSKVMGHKFLVATHSPQIIGDHIEYAHPLKEGILDE